MTTRWAGCLVALLTVLVPGVGEAQVEIDVPDSVLHARLDSLQNMALTASTHSGRLTGVIGVMSVGQLWYFSHPERRNQPPPRIPVRGLVDRVETIFNQTDDPLLRSHIVKMVRYQSERGEAIEFLMRVARSPARPGDGSIDLPHRAVVGLSVMGDRGMAALQRLHAEESVKSGLARVYLEKVETNGWRPVGGGRK